MPLAEHYQARPRALTFGANITHTLWARAARAGIARLVWGVYGICLLVIWGTIASGFYLRTIGDDQQTRDRAVLNAKGFAEYVGLNFFVLDRLMADLAVSYRKTGQLPQHADMARELGDIGAVLQQVAIADARGNILASTLPLNGRVSIADRKHFKDVQESPRDALYISQPVVGRVSGRMSLQLVRPIKGPDGNFEGVIVGSIDPTLLQSYFRNYDGLSSEGVVTLAGLDGVLRLRMHGDDISWGQNVSSTAAWPEIIKQDSGRYASKSVVDGLAREYAFKRVGAYPIAVIVGYAHSGVLDLLDEGSIVSLALALIFSALLTVLAYIISRLGHDQLAMIRQLRISRAKAMEANQMKSNFLASVTHELRTPLNSILGFSELIRESTVDPITHRYADLVHRSGKHLHSLVGTVLDLAKIEAGRMEQHRESVDMRELLGAIVEVHQVTADQKRLTLSLALEGTAPIPITTDRTKVVQVLNNVLHNAVKFTQTGGIFVTGRMADAHRFVITVVDSGCGIEPKMLAHVFDRFNTLSSPHEQQLDRGSGLGLALSRELMELIGGTITLASEPGQGTHVEITLPLENPDD